MSEGNSEERARPFRIIDGKKWVLAEDEPWDESEPEQLRLIPVPPRDIPFAVQMRLLFSSGIGSGFGLFFACFGLTFALFAVYVVGLHGAFPRQWTDAGTGKIIKVDDLNPAQGSRDRFHFTTIGPDGEEIVASCRRQMEKHKLGDEVPLERSGKRYRIKGMQDQFEIWAFVGMGTFFGLIGMSIAGISLYLGSRKIRLIRNGVAGSASYFDMKVTQTTINGRPLVKLSFQHRVGGELYTFHFYTLDSEKYTDGKTKIVFFDPFNPEKGILLESLKGIALDDLTGRFHASLWPSLFSMFMLCVVCCQFLAIIVGIGLEFFQ